ncbi:transposase [Kitasatospora sp. NPDC002965]|uniref:transposase n=1 Tax=Kitasatospora sp. NPDC002965 TaxID=3154775 RepID=UPI0033A75392
MEPSAGLIDSQSVRTADTVPVETRGFDAGKKVKGRKRFIVTDTLGLLLAVHVVAASIQDRDGAKRPLLWTRLDHSGVKKVWADQGFASRLVEWTPRSSAATWRSSARTPTSTASRSSPSDGRSSGHCAPRGALFVSPVQPGGTRKEVPGPDDSPGSER